MADINIASFPAAGAYADADIFHISQSGVDKKTVLSAMDARFSKVDIYGLTETLSPTTAMFVAVGVDGTIANNKKVSLEKLGQLVQAESLFVNDEDIDKTDEIPFRKDDAATLNQCTVGGLAKRILTFTELDNSTNAGTTVDTDFYVIYDTSAAAAKRISVLEQRQSVLTPSTLTALTTPDSADYFYLYDTSAADAKKITYSNLFTAITSALPFDDRISSTTADAAAGLIDFQAGIKTNTIVPSSGTGITLTGKLTVNNEIASAKGSFTNVSGKFWGAAGDATNLYMTSRISGLDNIWDVKCTQLNPVVNNQTQLGTSSLKWKNLYSIAGNIDSLTVATAATLPVGTTINNGVGQTAILSSGKFNTNLLPTSTESAIGAIELSTLAELQANSPAALTQAITAGLLAQCIEQGSGVITIGAGTAPIYGGSLKIGGMLAQWVKVEPAADIGEATIPLLFSNYSWLHDFGDTHYFIGGGAITGWGLGYPTSIQTTRATIATTGFTYAPSSFFNPDAQIREHFIFMIGKA